MQNDILLKFAKNLKKIRICKKYTQQYVSECLDIDRGVYARYESNNPPDLKQTTLVRILEFFDIDLNELLK